MLTSKEQKQLVESQLMIAESLKGIQENLKQLNDQNVLHSEKLTDLTITAQNDHKTIIDTLKMMTDKYWWLIISLVVTITAFSGYKFLSQGV